MRGIGLDGSARARGPFICSSAKRGVPFLSWPAIEPLSKQRGHLGHGSATGDVHQMPILIDFTRALRQIASGHPGAC